MGDSVPVKRIERTCSVRHECAGPRGNFFVDGTLQKGESGGPVFNTDGAVVGLLSGGHLATGQDLVVTLIRLAEPLLARADQWPVPEKENRYPASCFPECTNPAHGVVGWENTQQWNQSSGWLGGGNNQSAVCNGLARGFEQQNPGWWRFGAQASPARRSSIGNFSTCITVQGSLDVARYPGKLGQRLAGLINESLVAGLEIAHCRTGLASLAEVPLERAVDWDALAEASLATYVARWSARSEAQGSPDRLNRRFLGCRESPGKWIFEGNRLWL